MKKMGVMLLLFCLGLPLSLFATNPTTTVSSGYLEAYDKSPEDYLNAAAHEQGSLQIDDQLKAIGRLIQDRRFDQAETLSTQVKSASLTPLQNAYLQLLLAQLNLLQNHAEFAMAALNQINNPDHLPIAYQIVYYQLLATTDHNIDNPMASALDLIHLQTLLPVDMQVMNTHLIWQRLQEVNTTELNAFLHQTPNPVAQGWIDLAYRSKMYQDDPSLLAQEETDWSATYPNHPASLFLVTMAADAPNVASLPTHKIALLLPESGPLYLPGKAIKTGFTQAIADKQGADSSTPLSVYNETPNPTQAYETAISAGANIIIGPLMKTDVSRIATLKATPLTLALNAVPNLDPSANLFQFALSPEDEAQQVAEKALQEGHHHALIIAPDSAWGKTVVQAFSTTWTAKKGYVVDAFWYQGPHDIDKGLQHLLALTPTHQTATPYAHRQDVDMIFLLAEPVVARQIMPLLYFYNSADIPVYATSMVYTGKPNAMLDKDMDGIHFCDLPFILDPSTHHQAQLAQFLNRMPEAQPSDYRLFAFGYDAYQLIDQLSTLSHDPQQGYSGLTGILYLGDNQEVKRLLPWAVFRAGVPRIIPD